MKKLKTLIAIIAFMFAILLTSLPVDSIQAKSKNPVKLSAKDFVYTLNGKKIDFLKQSKKNESYHVYYWETETQDTENASDDSEVVTYRNVDFDSTASYIKKQYGKTKKVKISKKEKYYKYIKYGCPNVDFSIWDSYLEYAYEKSDNSYKIRFYLDKKDKVAAIIYLKNLEKFYNYPNNEFGVELSFVPPEGTMVTQKNINGKNVYVLPKGTKIYYKNYSSVYEVIDTYMQQWDKHSQEIVGNYAITQGGSDFDAEIIKTVYEIDVNLPNGYLYISMQIYGDPKYAPKVYYIKFE